MGNDGDMGNAIVDAALDIIATSGLTALTLRPLASRVGVTVPVISSRMGSKEQLIERVVHTAIQRDRVFQERWRILALQLTPATSAARAAIADLAFRDWLTTCRERVILLIELVHARALQPGPAPVLERWLEDIGIFWSTLLFGSGDLADLARGYMLDEAAFALSSGGNDAYALLRVLCLQRFADGLLARGEATPREIESMIAALKPRDLPLVSDDDPKRRRIAEGAARIIVSLGMEATTHRAVAQAADVPASTVVYHFGGRDALAVAGLHAVIAQFHGSRDRAIARNEPDVDVADSRDLVKATSLIALASVREPSLLPYALDMRRRRGENIRPSALEGLGLRYFGSARFDRAAAQVISVALFGLRMVAMGRGLPESECYQSAFSALDAWRQSNPD